MAMSGKKVTVTVKLAIQLVAPETARAAPRNWLGNISPSSTHITGPHDMAKATMYRFAAVKPATAAIWLSNGLASGPTLAVSNTIAMAPRVRAIPTDPINSNGLR